jgi:hypothetical protein
MKMTNLVELSAIPQPDNAVVLSANTTLEQVEKITIVTPQDYEAVGALVLSIKGRWNAIEAQRVKLKKPIDDAARAVQDFFRKPLEALASAERIGKNRMALYHNQQEALRRAEQAKVDEAARKERERLEARATKAAEAGKEEKAEALQQTAAAVVAPTISSAKPKVTGVSFRAVTKFRVKDPALVPRQYLIVDETKVRTVVSALGMEANIPGIETYEETVIASRSA